MTGSRTQSGPAPTYLRITLGEGPPTQTQSHQADRPASADSMHRAGPASRPFVLATLRALRLDPGPYPVLSTRRPKTSKTTAQQPLDTPRPFRDDSASSAAVVAGKSVAASTAVMLAIPVLSSHCSSMPSVCD